jgi:nucleotide-binding universal stress UspA family protein
VNKRILVPLDGSKLSEEVLPLVRSLIESNNTEIILLRVVEYPYTLYYGCDEYPPFDPEQAKIIQDKKRAIYQEVRGYLEQVASPLITDGLTVSVEVCEGQVVESILESAGRLCVDLIVLSACGESGASHIVIGAIADRILREARVQVILVRPVSCSVVSGASLENRIPLSV